MTADGRQLNLPVEQSPAQRVRAAAYRRRCPLPPRRPGERPEVLSPAGSFEKLVAAVRYGADAVYLAGRRFGLRAYADNFDDDALERAVDFAHRNGTRVYVTLNILARPADLADLPPVVRHLSAIGADAVIVSDPGVFSEVRALEPDLDIHISTQASVTNEAACRFWHAAGARRIILARELSLTDIAAIRRGIPRDLSLEAFAHGAMCMAWSGRCLLSNQAVGRDANQGACTQPCRWRYHVTETGRLQASGADEASDPYTWAVESDETGSYLFSSRDLCMIDHVPDMLRAGVDSLKIEGRMKGAYYVAIVTKAYREAVDAWLADPDAAKPDPAWRRELNSVVHRDYDTGFYFDHPMRDAKITAGQMFQAGATVVAVVPEERPPDMPRADRPLFWFEQRNKLLVGDTVELIRPYADPVRWRLGMLWSADGVPVSACPHPQQRFWAAVPSGVDAPPGSFLRRPGQKYGESPTV